jgi:hypothetical protein
MFGGLLATNLTGSLRSAKRKNRRVIDTVVYRFTTYYRKKMLKEREDTFCDKGVDMKERVIHF